jgi:hypothetical protein
MVTRCKYTGSALPGNAETVVLFSTAALPMANWGPTNGIHSYHFNIKHDQSGTVKGYKSVNRGTSWIQFYDSGAIAAPTYTTADVVLVEGLADFKFEWVNGASPQTAFTVDQDLSTFP